MKKFAIIISLLGFISVTTCAASSVELQKHKSKKTEHVAKMKVAKVASVYKGIVKLHVKLGEYVKKGQLLFEVKQDILDLQKNFNESDLKFMQRCMQGADGLIANHSISLDDYQQCQRDLGAAEYQLKKTQAHIKFSKYYAPFDGTVTKIVRYDGSGLGDNDEEIEVTQGNVKVNTENRVGLVCTRWPGVLELEVKLGDKVRKGQLLFKTQTDDIEAQKKIDENKLIYSKKLFNRSKKLFKTSTVSLYNYYLSKIEYKEALKNVETNEIQIKQSSMYAPFDGTITQIFRYSGSGNGAGKPVLNITAFK